jgi:hypothetical protein
LTYGGQTFPAKTLLFRTHSFDVISVGGVVWYYGYHTFQVFPAGYIREVAWFNHADDVLFDNALTVDTWQTKRVEMAAATGDFSVFTTW